MISKNRFIKISESLIKQSCLRDAMANVSTTFNLDCQLDENQVNEYGMAVDDLILHMLGDSNDKAELFYKYIYESQSLDVVLNNKETAIGSLDSLYDYLNSY